MRRLDSVQPISGAVGERGPEGLDESHFRVNGT